MKELFQANKEREFLNSLVSDYKDVSPYSRIKKDIILNMVDDFLKKVKTKRALQMGCSNGYETEQLSKRFNQLDVLDGSDVFIKKIQKEKTYKNINFICSLFEEFLVNDEAKKYDYIFCNYVLEHVYDSKKVLNQISKILKPEGILFVVVPNAFALSRRIALQMKLLKKLDALTENDNSHGHRRVYTLEKIFSELESSGFKILQTKGIVFKILADFQLNELLKDGFLTREHIVALQELSNLPDNINFSDSFFIVSQLNLR